MLTRSAAPASDGALQSGRDVRLACRSGGLDGPTAGLAPGFVQGNLAILPRDWADEFLRFCVANPKPCPLIGIAEPGDPRLPALATDLDIRTDLGRYRVWRDGQLADEPADIRTAWRDDLVSFVIGCSFSFEEPLIAAGIPIRHIARGCNVSMYRTNVATTPAGRRTPSGRCRSPRDYRPCTAHPCISAFRKRSASRISTSRTSAMRYRWNPANCRCSGPAV